MNTECDDLLKSVCVTDNVFETSINCCSSNEEGDSSFQDCKGWCSAKAIEEADEDGDIPEAFLIRYAPGVSTNMDCLFWWSYLGVGADNDT